VLVLVHDTVGVDPQVGLVGVALDHDIVAGRDVDPNERVAALDGRCEGVGRGQDGHDFAAEVTRLGGVGERSRRHCHDDDSGRQGDRQSVH
jgi:hypothetical protein